MDGTVIICTYNRAESLKKTLDSFTRASTPAKVAWELIVVDNNSTDGTRKVCEEFTAKLPLRYLMEKRQGHTFARNCGLNAAKGGIIAFTDDDVDVREDWITELWRASNAHPEAAFFGGPVEPRWERRPPRWMEANSRTITGITMDFSLGEEARQADAEHLFIGANMAFRRETIAKVGLFREDLGMRGKAMGVRDESEYMSRILQAGLTGVYWPGLVVYHRNPARRSTEGYMLEWFAGCGRSDVRMGYFEATKTELFGAPRYLWRRLVKNAGGYAVKRLDFSAQATWLPHAIEMARTWGAIQEFREMHPEKPSQ
jgi:glycosyltransferase involved in cell wall biosynthesis